MNDNLKFLSQYMAKQFYKILKVNLINSTFEVIKNAKAESEKLYVGSDYNEYLKIYLNSNYIHVDDLDIVNEKLNLNFLKKYFSKNNNELDCWFRRKFEIDYRWTLVKIIKSEQFSVDHNIYYVMQDNDVPSKVKLNTKILDEYKILKALTTLFISMYIIDLETDTYVDYKTNKFISKFTTSKIASLDLKNCATHLLLEKYQKEALIFTDLKTLSERIKNNNFISNESISKNYGWVRYSFFPIAYDENGKLSSVIFAVSNINKQKVKEQSLIKLSHHDGLTGLFNRYSFEKDIHNNQFNTKNCVIVAADINFLKQINDTYGHKTGDEIIKRAANCLYKVLSTYGKVYRTGGDEFVGIIYVSLKELNNILTNIKHEIDIENYKCKIKLSLSIGTADFNENSNLNIEEIIQSADKNMYLNKNDFHKNNVF